MSDYDESQEFDFYDREQKKQKAAEFLEGMQALQAEQQQKYITKTFAQVDKKHAKRLMEAAKKRGYTEQHLQALYQANPGLSYEAINEGRKQFNKRILRELDAQFGRSRAGRSVHRPGRQPETPRRRGSDEERILESARQKAAQKKPLRFDEEDAIIDSLLGDLF